MAMEHLPYVWNLVERCLDGTPWCSCQCGNSRSITRWCSSILFSDLGVPFIVQWLFTENSVMVKKAKPRSLARSGALSLILFRMEIRARTKYLVISNQRKSPPFSELHIPSFDRTVTDNSALMIHFIVIGSHPWIEPKIVVPAEQLENVSAEYRQHLLLNEVL